MPPGFLAIRERVVCGTERVPPPARAEVQLAILTHICWARDTVKDDLAESHEQAAGTTGGAGSASILRSARLARIRVRTRPVR